MVNELDFGIIAEKNKDDKWYPGSGNIIRLTEKSIVSKKPFKKVGPKFPGEVLHDGIVIKANF